MTRRHLCERRVELLSRQRELLDELAQIRRELAAAERRLELTCHTRHRPATHEAEA